MLSKRNILRCNLFVLTMVLFVSSCQAGKVLKGGFESFDIKAPASTQQWEKNKPQLREKVRSLLGDMPPLFMPKVTVDRKEKRKDYTLEHFTFENGIGDKVYGYLLIPAGLKGKAPAILYNHQHGGAFQRGGKEEILFDMYSQTGHKYIAGEELTRAGYVVMCIDAYAFGERLFQGPAGKKERGRQTQISLYKTFLWQGRTLWGMILHDDLLSLNYLVSRDEVDTNRIGTIGMSMGATRTWWLAALDERIKVAVSVSCLTRHQNLIAEGRLKNHGIYYYIPNVLKEGIDTELIVGLIAPRAHLTLTGDKDYGSPTDGVRIINNFQKNLYKLYGKDDNFRGVIYPDVGHLFTDEMWNEAMDWFKKHL